MASIGANENNQQEFERRLRLYQYDLLIFLIISCAVWISVYTDMFVYRQSYIAIIDCCTVYMHALQRRIEQTRNGSTHPAMPEPT